MRHSALASIAFLFCVSTSTSAMASGDSSATLSGEAVPQVNAQAGFKTALAPSIEYFQTRFPLTNVYDKLVDNHGDGFESLYGVRNFRAVLNGVVYRGGANNAYNKHKKRSNSNPLPNEGLENLCKEGFGTAVYLYSTNYATAPKVTRCTSNFGSNNEIDYKQDSPLSGEPDARAILKLIYDRLSSQSDKSPIYLHCWNGWHSSGYISALTLRQYCGFTGAQAVTYWDRNTDGNNTEAGFEAIRKKIRAFTPYAEFQISSALRAKICPVAR